MKKIYNFPEKSELSEFTFPVKTNCMTFSFLGFPGGEKICRDQSRLSFSYHPKFAFAAKLCMLMLQHEPCWLTSCVISNMNPGTGSRDLDIVVYSEFSAW